jgi:hypothetical protein
LRKHIINKNAIMKTNIELHRFEELLNKMKMLNINEAYPHFTKNGVVLYLMPCDKAKFICTRKDIEEIIRVRQNELLKVV